MQKDMFSGPMAVGKSLVLELRGIPVPRRKKKGQVPKVLPPNCHIPSIKNAKMWLTKLPNGQPLKRPILITKPEYQQWRERAVRHLESQLFTTFQITEGEILRGHSKLFAMLSQLPADDSMTDLPGGSWTVDSDLCAPERAGVTITIERLK